MATPREVALDHYSDRQNFVNATAEAAGSMWSEVDPKAISKTWAAQVPEMAAVVTGAQLGVARLSDDYLDDILDAEDADPFSVADIDPAAFRGASDGRGLLGLLANPAIVALMAIKDGWDIARAMTSGAANLDMLVRTQVSDAGRAADQVALTARPAAKGYVRMAVGKTCARCLLLSGRFYLFNAGFQRHPRCDCIHVPAGDARAGRIPGPRQLYDNLSGAERSRAGFSLGDQRALADGADFSQVVNAKRGMYTAGGRRFTTEGTTKRGFASTRLEGRPRLTPDEIFRIAGPDRDEALRLLHQNGYLLEAPVPAPRLAVAAAQPSPAAASGATGRGATTSTPTIRPVLEAARTATAVERAFAEEFERITGRNSIVVSFHGSAPATAREHAEGLLRGLERFPEATLDRVVGFDIGTEYASAAGTAIRFSPQWTTPADRKRYLDAVASDARSGWHPRGTGNPVAIAVHEFGHVLDIATLGSVRRKEIQTLLERRAGHRDAAIKAQRDAGDFVDAEDFVAGSGVEGLITREISQYATKNTDELVAEAFSDVVMNGAAASQLSREIFDLIDREYRRGGRRVGTSTVVSASEPAPRAALTTARFEARINAAKTGAAAENLPPVQVRIDASAGSDVGKWRAVEVTGLQGPQSGLLSATTSRVRTSGLANPRLRGETARDIEQRLQLEQVGLGPTPVQAARRAASADREIAALDRAMDQSRLPSDAVVWRVGRPTGVDIPAEGTAVGLEWTDLGFVGTSARRNVAESFAADNRTLMRILAPKDTPAIGIAGGGEAEVLLGRGLRFRVVGESRTAGGARLLDVEVVPAAGTVAPIGAPVAVAQNLSKLTIPKLKEIAAARGIHLPPRARKAEILALLDPPTAGTVTKAQVRADARAAARERNKQIEARGPVEDMLAEVDELLGKSSSTDVMLEHLDALSGVPAADLAALRKAVQTGDRTKIRAAVTRLGNKHGLKAAAPAGKKVAFDPEQHELFGGGEIAAGTQVVVVRRGTTLTIDGETIVFNRARVAVVEAPPKKVTPPKSAPNAYELAPGYKGALARRRHAERDEALMAVADAGSLSVHQAPGTIEVLDVLGSMGYVRRDGSRWRLTDKGQAYADGRKGVASPAPGTAAQITPAEARKMLKFAEVVDAMIHNNALKPGVGDLILEQSARDLGIPTAARDTVIKALLTGSPEQTRAAMAGVFRSAGVKTAAKPGTVVSFDPKIHVAPGRTKVAPGAEVRISEPGLQIEAGGKTVILTKTRVEPPARTTRTLPPEIRRVADLSQTPETGRRALGGGMTGEVHEVTYPGGQVLVRKELGRRAEDVRPVAEQIDAEELAPMVYAALGVRVPATYRATDRVIYMERLEGRTLDEILGWGQFPGPDLLDSDQGRLMGLGDWLVQDTDRNKGGFLVDADGNLWSLDHGFAFERNAEDMVGGRFEFAGHFDGTNNGPTNDMSPADMAEIRTRLDGLRGEFERVGRLTWWRAMMKRMDEAAKGATGTRSRL